MSKKNHHRKKILCDAAVCADLNWRIGNKGGLLVHIPEDMESFKKFTKDSILIMGRKTQESFPNHKYLKGRINIVMSHRFKRNAGYQVSYGDKVKDEVLYSELYYVNSMDDAYNLANEIYFSNKKEFSRIVVIGGATIYKEFLDAGLIKTVLLTRVYSKYDCDASIPDLYSTYGFKHHNGKTNIVTGYESITKSRDGKHNFSIRALTK